VAGHGKGWASPAKGFDTASSYTFWSSFGLESHRKVMKQPAELYVVHIDSELDLRSDQLHASYFSARGNTSRDIGWQWRKWRR
jgi:hypothetical protein